LKFNPPSIPLADIQDKSNSENILAGISFDITEKFTNTKNSLPSETAR